MTKKDRQLIIGSILFTVLLIEVILQFFAIDRFDFRSVKLESDPVPTLQIPNSSDFRSQRNRNGKLIYRFEHSYDEFGRRKTPKISSAKEAHLFFGGSFVYGDGLKEEQTLPWVFSDLTGIQTYNYAYIAFGPNNVLAQINENNINDQVPQNIESIDASFFSYYFHIERYTGSFGWIGKQRTNDPYFKIINGKLTRLGNFTTHRPVLTTFYWLLWKIKLLRLFMQKLDNSFNTDNQKLLCSIINESFLKLKTQLKDRLNNFNFIIGPYNHVYQPAKALNDYYNGVKKCLDPKIKVYEIDPPEDFFSNRRLYQVHPEDTHPSALANEFLTIKMMELIYPETNK